MYAGAVVGGLAAMAAAGREGSATDREAEQRAFAERLAADLEASLREKLGLFFWLDLLFVFIFSELLYTFWLRVHTYAILWPFKNMRCKRPPSAAAHRFSNGSLDV
jgi:hypothetical protein